MEGTFSQLSVLGASLVLIFGLILLGFGGILDSTVTRAWSGAPWTDAGGGALLVPVLAVVAVGTVGTAVFRTVWIARRLPALDPPGS